MLETIYAVKLETRDLSEARICVGQNAYTFAPCYHPCHKEAQNIMDHDDNIPYHSCLSLKASNKQPERREARLSDIYQNLFN